MASEPFSLRTYDSPGMRPRSTSRLGWARRSFINGSRLWPPARTLASGSSSRSSASCRVLGAAYANLAGNIYVLLTSRRSVRNSRGRLAHGHVGLFQRFLAAQFTSSRERRLDDVLVARAAAQVAVQTAPHLCLARVRIVAQQLVYRD